MLFVFIWIVFNHKSVVVCAPSVSLASFQHKVEIYRLVQIMKTSTKEQMLILLSIACIERSVKIKPYDGWILNWTLPLESLYTKLSGKANACAFDSEEGTIMIRLINTVGVHGTIMSSDGSWFSSDGYPFLSELHPIFGSRFLMWRMEWGERGSKVVIQQEVEI